MERSLLIGRRVQFRTGSHGKDSTGTVVDIIRRNHYDYYVIEEIGGKLCVVDPDNIDRTLDSIPK